MCLQTREQKYSGAEQDFKKVSLKHNDKFLSKFYQNSYRKCMSPMLQNSYALQKPALVWTVMFRNLLYPSLWITIFAAIDTSYGLNNFWFRFVLSLNSIRVNDWYDFRKIFAPRMHSMNALKSYFDRFSKNYFPIKIYQRCYQNERVADHFAEIRLAKF